MASTDSQLEERLVEVGKKLLSPPSDVGELLSLLDEAETIFSKVEQSPKQSVSTSLLPSMKGLVAKELLRHSDADVKVFVTSCISEITRITAPEPPYDDDLMKEIFERIVEALTGLDDFSGRSYSKRVLILETVAKVRSCLVMLDLECDELILRMIRLFFEVIRSNHPDKVFKSMETIMTLILEESEDISADLVSCLLSSVKKQNKDVSPVAISLGENVIKNCKEILKSTFNDVIHSTGSRLTDYSGIVASVCQGTYDKFRNSNSSECLIEDNNLSEGTVSEELPQGSENLDGKVESRRVGTDAVKSSKTATSNISSDRSIKKLRGQETKLGGSVPADAKDSLHNPSKRSNNKTILTTSPIPSVTPDAIRPRRGRPPGSKSHAKKEVTVRNDSGGKKLGSVENKDGGTSDDGHSRKKRTRRGKQWMGSSEDEVAGNSNLKKIASSPKAILKGDKVQGLSMESKKANSRRKLGKFEEKGVNLDEKLIGSAIKVWWPMDKKFYRGVVDSFDPLTKKHRVLYADGDTEILLLKEERWEFVQNDSSSSEEGAEDPLSPNPPIMPMKKATSNSVSIKKQVKTEKEGGPSASGRKRLRDGHSNKSNERAVDMYKETSGNANEIKEEYVKAELGPPEVPCKSTEDISMKEKSEDKPLSGDSKSKDRVSQTSGAHEEEATKTNKSDDGTQNVSFEAMDIEASSRDIPGNDDTPKEMTS